MLLVLFSVCVSINAQNIKPKKDKPTKKYGFVNEAGDWVVQPVWDDADKMRDGLAVVKLNKKKGLIDETGKVLLEPQFDNIGSFDGEFAEIELDDKKGLIKKSGAILFAPQFDKIYDFKDKIAKVKLNRKYGFISDAGKILLPAEYDDVDNFRDGISIIEKDKLKGFCDVQGKVLAAPAYSKIGSFDKDMADIQKDSKWGLIQRSGKIIWEPRFNEVIKFNQKGIAIVLEATRFGVVNDKGVELLPTVSERITEDDGLYFVKNPDAWKIYNSDIKQIGGSYEEIMSFYSFGSLRFVRSDRIGVRKNEKWGFLDAKGKEVIKPQFNRIQTEGFQSGFCAVQLGEKWGYIRPDGSWFKEAQFDEAQSFIGLGGVSVAKVKRDGVEYSLKPDGKLEEIQTIVKQEPVKAAEEKPAATVAEPAVVAAKPASSGKSVPAQTSAGSTEDDSWLMGTWMVEEEFMGSGKTRKGKLCTYARYEFHSNHRGDAVERDLITGADYKKTGGAWKLQGSKLSLGSLTYTLTEISADKKSMKIKGILGTWWSVRKK